MILTSSNAIHIQLTEEHKTIWLKLSSRRTCRRNQLQTQWVKSRDPLITWRWIPNHLRLIGVQATPQCLRISQRSTHLHRWGTQRCGSLRRSKSLLLACPQRPSSMSHIRHQWERCKIDWGGIHGPKTCLWDARCRGTETLVGYTNFRVFAAARLTRTGTLMSSRLNPACSSFQNLLPCRPRNGRKPKSKLWRKSWDSTERHGISGKSIRATSCPWVSTALKWPMTVVLADITQRLSYVDGFDYNFGAGWPGYLAEGKKRETWRATWREGEETGAYWTTGNSPAYALIPPQSAPVPHDYWVQGFIYWPCYRRRFLVEGIRKALTCRSRLQIRL